MSNQDSSPRKNTENDPPAANQPLDDDDLERAGGPQPSSATTDAKPKPSPVPVADSRGGQVPPGKPDGEVDTRP